MKKEEPNPHILSCCRTKEECHCGKYSKQETLEDDFMVWDELFGILAWKFKPTKSGDMFLDAEKVFQELKSKFELKKKKDYEKLQRTKLYTV